MSRTTAEAIRNKESCLGESLRPAVLAIKNTFIEVSIPTGSASQMRRSLSSPSSFQSADALKLDAEKVDSEVSTDLCTEGSDFECPAPKFGPQISVSGAYQVPPVGCAGSGSMGLDTAAPWSPSSAKAQARQPCTTPGRQLPPPPPAGVAPQFAQLKVPVPPLQPCQAFELYEIIHKFNRQVSCTVSSIKAALGGCSRVLAIQCVEEGIEGWALTIEVGAEDLQHTEYLLSLAKKALLANTNKAPCVMVMGHRSMPFRPFPQGFVATLGFVQNKSKACYEAYGKGYCHRGGFCRWQHPPCKRSIKVALALAAKQNHHLQ